jgi:hypothetical protein
MVVHTARTVLAHHTADTLMEATQGARQVRIMAPISEFIVALRQSGASRPPILARHPARHLDPVTVM